MYIKGYCQLCPSLGWIPCQGELQQPFGIAVEGGRGERTRKRRKRKEKGGGRGIGRKRMGKKEEGGKSEEKER